MEIRKSDKLLLLSINITWRLIIAALRHNKRGLGFHDPLTRLYLMKTEVIVIYYQSNLKTYTIFSKNIIFELIPNDALY